MIRNNYRSFQKLSGPKAIHQIMENSMFLVYYQRYNSYTCNAEGGGVTMHMRDAKYGIHQ